MLPSTKVGLGSPLQPSEPRQLHKHAQCPKADGKFAFRCWATAAALSKGCRLPTQGPGSAEERTVSGPASPLQHQHLTGLHSYTTRQKARKS